MDCAFSDYTKSPCTKPCGGGATYSSRTILTPGKDGGILCNGTFKKVEACNEQNCSAKQALLVGNDCSWAEWADWGACDRCGGQRKRFRHIGRQAGLGGNACAPAGTEEVQSCSRHCHNGGRFCSWAPWSLWSTCSATCGNGRLSRNRQLMLANTQAFPAIPDTHYLEQKFEALRLDMTTSRSSHQNDIMFAFSGGCVSFLTLAAAIRLFNRVRDQESSSSRGAPME